MKTNNPVYSNSDLQHISVNHEIRNRLFFKATKAQHDIFELRSNLYDPDIKFKKICFDAEINTQAKKIQPENSLGHILKENVTRKLETVRMEELIIKVYAQRFLS